ncbi:MAG TPA: hypothetical protein VEA79_12485 [Phenylobacterium sp.]|nr:hypothetical protein [Phenylobacterium sp.]
MRHWLIALATLACAHPAAAERMVFAGGLPPSAGAGAPPRFILDVEVWPVPNTERHEMSGWLAMLQPRAKGGGAVGACEAQRCKVQGEALYEVLQLEGALLDPASTTSAFTYNGPGTPEQAGEAQLVRLTSLDLGDLGVLAPEGAVGGLELADLLDWAGFTPGFRNDPEDGPPGPQERKALAAWQDAQGRPAAGLIRVGDLEQLRAARTQKQAEWRWTPASGEGWKGGVPLALLAAQAEPGRYASADGEARLVLRRDAPMDDAAWRAFVAERTSENENKTLLDGTRIDDDMEVAFTVADRTTHAAYHRTPKGVATLVFSYPTAQAEQWRLPATLMVRAFRAAE